MNWRAWLDRMFGTAPETTAIVEAAERVGSGFSRRQFLRGALAATAIAATVDVEQLLWTPGEKTIFLPESVELYEGLLTPDWVTREALRILQNNLKFASQFSRDYDEHFVGETVNVRIPRRYSTRANPYGIVDRSVAVTLDEQHGCMIEPPTAADLRDRPAYIRREVEPLMAHMAWKLNEKKVDVFADLPLPKCVERSNIVRADGVSLRGIKAYDPTEARYKMRLDVLGGSTQRRRRA